MIGRMNTATRLVHDATTSGADDYVTENESERSSERRNDKDVSENEIRPRSASSRDASSPLHESPSGTENESDVTNELTKTFQKGAQILPCPEYRKMKEMRKILALEEGNIIFDLTLPPTLLMNTDISQICKLMSRQPLRLTNDLFTWDYSDFNIYTKKQKTWTQRPQIQSES